jgi:GH25 family lysozyme M1 (1,4-beta-N-acetylmuramidase)
MNSTTDDHEGGAAWPRAALVPIAFADVLPGDALFFERTYDIKEPSKVGDGHVASHIGMSLGAGTRRMLNAVEPVSKETDISTAYWQDRILSAGRLPALVGAVDVSGDPSTQTVEGIDLASYQGKPDWDQIAAAGIKFAIIKATEGTDYVNPTFAYNWTNAQRVGIVRAAYHWGKPDEGAADQAQFFLNTVGPLGPTDFLMLDSEEGSGDVGAWTLSCLKLLRAAVGFAPVDYTGRWFSDPHGFPDHPELAEFPLALAAYQDALPPAPAPWTKVTIWQYSDAGQIPGIVGNVDRDRFLGTLEQLRAIGKPGAVAPAPPAPPAPASSTPNLGTLVGVAYHEDGVILPALLNARKSGDWSQVDAVVKFLRENNPNRAA